MLSKLFFLQIIFSVCCERLSEPKAAGAGETRDWPPLLVRRRFIFIQFFCKTPVRMIQFDHLPNCLFVFVLCFCSRNVLGFFRLCRLRSYRIQGCCCRGSRRGGRVATGAGEGPGPYETPPEGEPKVNTKQVRVSWSRVLALQHT